MAGVPDLTGVFLGTGPAVPASGNGAPTPADTNSGSRPDLSSFTPSWAGDGTVANDPGFDSWMKDFAFDRFKQDVDSWMRQTGADPTNPSTFSNIPLTADGKSIDYTKVDMGGNGHTLQSYIQELGEGDQGKTLYKYYQQGLSLDQLNKAYANQDFGQIGVAQGGTVAQPLFNHQGQTGMDESKIGFDPNRGFITTASNVHGDQGATMDKVWETVGQMAPMLIMAPMLAGVGAALASGSLYSSAGMTAADVGASEGAGVSGALEGTSLGATNGSGLLSGSTLSQIVQKAPGLAKNAFDMLGNKAAGAFSAATTTTKSAPTTEKAPAVPDLTSTFLGTDQNKSNTGIVNSAMGS